MGKISDGKSSFTGRYMWKMSKDNNYYEIKINSKNQKEKIALYGQGANETKWKKKCIKYI